MFHYSFRSTLQDIASNDSIALIEAQVKKTGTRYESSLTYAELRSNVERVSRTLMSLNLPKDTVITSAFVNDIRFVITFLGITNTGFASNPLNPGYTVDEASFYLEDTKSPTVLVPAELPLDAPICQAAKRLGRNLIYVSFDRSQKTISLTKEDHSAVPASSSSLPIVSHDTTALVLHTSGTTSRPKAVPITHGSLSLSAINIAQTYSLSANDVGLLVMPLFHVHGLVAGLLAPLQIGGTVIIQSPRFSASSFFPLLLKYRCSWYTAVPTMHQILLKHVLSLSPTERQSLKDTISSPLHGGRLRFVRSCSSALAPATHQALEEAFGVPVVEAYAMTEAAHQMTSNDLPPGRRIPGSVGRAQGTVRLQIRRDDGSIAKVGEEGEVCVGGPTITKGYLNNPTANKEGFTRDGFLRTGDRGKKDENGFVFLTGRLKEMINRGGEKIAPGEIDMILAEHPSILEGVAFAIPHAMLGQTVAAAVVLKPIDAQYVKEHGKKAEAKIIENIKQHIAKKLSKFKVPEVIYLTDSLPRTATGKLQRRLVAEHFLNITSTKAKL